MLTGGWRIGRIGGVEIRVDPSWSIIAVFITFNFWLFYSYRPRFPGLGRGPAGFLAVLTAALFFGSVLGHELAHAGMSKVRGIPVSGITLFLFGGATHAKVDAKGPADEFLITVVGPLTSAALGVVFLLIHSLGPQTLTHPFSSMFGYLAYINLLLAGFNLLPGFPLDGGRLLRSALWRVMGLQRGTYVAARVGQGVGLLIVAAGVATSLWTGDLLGFLWPAFIGWFLFRAASGSLVEGDRQRLLQSTTAREVMNAPPPSIPADLQVAVAMERYLQGHEGEAFPVIEDGHVVGFVSPRTARATPLDRQVRDAMVQGRGVIEAGAEETMESVTGRLGDQRGETVLVLDQGRLVGVIEREDLSRFLRRRIGLPPRPDHQRPRPDGPRPDGPQPSHRPDGQS